MMLLKLKCFCNYAVAVFEYIEDGLLIVVFGGMLVLAVLQIVLRNFFDSGLLWIEPLLRSAVLWIALLGALIAARADKHIAIDAFPKLLPPTARHVMLIFGNLFTAVIAGLIGWHALRFVMFDYQDGFELFAGMPVWWVECIIPFSFTVIALRYLVLFTQRAMTLLSRRSA